MATNYPNIEGGYVPIEDKVYSPSETRIWRQLRFGKADIPFYTVTAISGEPSSDSENILVIFTETSSIQWLGRRTNGYITIPAGKYFNTAQYDYSTAPKETTYYAVSECQLYWESEQFPLANDFYWDFYLTSGTLTQLHLIENASPNAPSTITVPDTVRGGADIDISWSAVTDPDGNLEGYELERQWDGAGAFTQIYKGAALSFQDTIPAGTHTSVIYRVRAYDSEGNYSSYCTGPVRLIINNAAPSMPEWCSVPNPVKGGTSIKITWPASTDPDNNLAGYILERKFNSNSWTQIYKGANRSYTDPIPLDKYKTVTYRVKAYDTKNAQSAYATSATRTIQNSTVLKFRLKTPIESSKRARYGQEIMTYTIPSGAIFKAEACNNGFDKNPTWEDVTEFVKKQKIFEFANKTKTASKWGYDIRVTIDRNGATGNCYFTRGNGFFEEEE